MAHQTILILLCIVLLITLFAQSDQTIELFQIPILLPRSSVDHSDVKKVTNVTVIRKNDTVVPVLEFATRDKIKLDRIELTGQLVFPLRRKINGLDKIIAHQNYKNLPIINAITEIQQLVTNGNGIINRKASFPDMDYKSDAPFPIDKLDINSRPIWSTPIIIDKELYEIWTDVNNKKILVKPNHDQYFRHNDEFIQIWATELAFITFPGTNHGVFIKLPRYFLSRPPSPNEQEP